MNRALKTLLMLIPGCATGTVISYQHKPTSTLRQTFDLGAPSLAPFSVGGVVVSPELASVSHNDRELVLYLLSDREASITVQSWSWTATGASSPAHAGEVHKVVPVGARADKGFTGEIVLGELKNAELETMFTAGPCTLSVTVAPGGGGADQTGADQTMVFRFEREEREVTGML